VRFILTRAPERVKVNSLQEQSWLLKDP